MSEVFFAKVVYLPPIAVIIGGVKEAIVNLVIIIYYLRALSSKVLLFVGWYNSRGDFYRGYSSSSSIPLPLDCLTAFM